MMEIRVWRAYSCNNSSSFRLVARFGDPRTAADAAAELKAFFEVHAKQQDERLERGEDYEQPTEAAKALGKKYGVDWQEMFAWGDDSQEGDEPIALAEGSTLVVYHSYCSGFGEELPKVLEALGAKVEPEDMDHPAVSALFRLPSDPAAANGLHEELRELFAQAEDASLKYINDWPIKPPWSGEDQVDGTNETDIGFFCDKKTMGFYLPIAPEHLDALKAYLTASGVESPVLRICEPSDLAKFRAIAKARCASCGEPLEYVDPAIHGIPTEQLACAKCGGMFELAPLVPPPPVVSEVDSA